MKNETEITIPVGDSTIAGTLHIVPNCESIIIFAHGSGSGRFSTRNRYVADLLNKSGSSTLLFDLLTKEEDAIDEITAEYRFDIEMLAERLITVTDWIARHEKTKQLQIGYFGSSTGAAAALIAAAKLSNTIFAVVSRGGRPDLAMNYLEDVTAATLLIVGELDHDVIAMNKRAYAKLTCEKHLEIIPGATHLFEEAGTLEKAAHIAIEWFLRHE